MISASADRLNTLFDHRLTSRPGWVVLAELFLGVGWLRAAIAKVGRADWWTGDTIVAFVGDHRAETIEWYRPVVDYVVVDYSAAWAVVVLAIEVTVALTLLTSVRMGAGLAAAIFLNVNFLLVGSPNPSVFYLMLQLALVLWLLESPTRQASLGRLRILATACIALTIVCVPFVRTLDPAAVIDDPASVLATWALCGTIAAIVAYRRVQREHLRIGLIDLSRAAAAEGVMEPSP